jgi:hypothetical protein
MPRLWKKKGIPHGGWHHIRILDIGEATGKCEMCDQPSVRYFDILKHPDYHSEIKVGQNCGSLMSALPNGSMRFPDTKSIIFFIPHNDKWRVMSKPKVESPEFDSKGEAAIWALDNLN